MALAWVAVAAVLAGCAYVLRRGASRQKANWRVMAQLPIEARRSLYLVAIGERRLVLGASESGLSLLTELDEQSAAALLADDRAVQKGLFRTLLGARR